MTEEEFFFDLALPWQPYSDDRPLGIVLVMRWMQQLE
jgi:hypothetical protein